MSKINSYKNVYLAGIGGIGVSALARLFKAQGAIVSGSDAAPSTITTDLEALGIKINYQPVAENLSAAVDLFIYTASLPEEHPEWVRARELGIPCFSYPQMLGEISRDYVCLAVSGTHGKSTTTSLLGLILTAGGLDPTVIVGTQVKDFDHNLRLGQSKYFVVEACEYRGHMLLLQSNYQILTNLEADHLDYYKDLADIIEHFDRFIAKLEDKNNLIINLDNPPLAKLSEKYGGRTYAIDQPAFIQAKNIVVKDGRQFFDLFRANENLGTLELRLPGKFNIYNALAAITAADSLGVKFSVYQKVLAEFSGCWRRFEVLGALPEVAGTTVISDYAHHPTAVRSTIAAAKEFFPGRRLLVVFQPHQHNRTKGLFDEFVDSFAGADQVILNEIYDAKGREELADQNVSSQDICREIVKRGWLEAAAVTYSPNLFVTEKEIKAAVQPGDVVLIMGAGDMDVVARKITGSR